MTAPILPPDDPTERPLLDLSGLVAGIRWRRRLWIALAFVGLLLGVAAATVLPTRATATADVFVIHENEESGDGQSLMKTDLALLQTTSVASVAVDTLKNGMTPENFVSMYSGAIIADNILEITARGSDDAEAMASVQAVADAFITVHVKQSSDAADATVKAYNDRRDQVQHDLDDVNNQIAAATNGADLQSLYNRRGELASQIASLAQQAQAAGVGSPQVAAGTKILNAPHRTSHGFLFGLLLYGGIGLGGGLALGLLVAAVAAVVRDRPVLRREIVAHLGASVVAQIPAPLRGPRRLIRRSSAEKERIRTAATLVRLVRESPKPVSVLELGCAGAAAALVRDMAEELSVERSVVVVDDLPGDQMAAALGQASSVELVPGAEFPPVTPAERSSRARQLAIGTVGPGTPWTDLRRLGAESLLVVRAGRTRATWLHTVARQLADAGIAVIGLVVVHPDPRDKSDGTVWDALHTAVRGRIAAGERAPALIAPPMQRPAAVNGYPVPQAQAAVAGRPVSNGSGPRWHNDAMPPNGAVPIGTRVMQIDSPTMVIPINRDRQVGKGPVQAQPVTTEPSFVDIVKAGAREARERDVEATVAVAAVVPATSSSVTEDTEDTEDTGAASGAIDEAPIDGPSDSPDPTEESGKDTADQPAESSEPDVELPEQGTSKATSAPADDVETASAETVGAETTSEVSEPSEPEGGDSASRTDSPISVVRTRPRVRPRPRPRVALADHATDKFRPVVPSTPANPLEAT